MVVRCTHFITMPNGDGSQSHSSLNNDVLGAGGPNGAVDSSFGTKIVQGMVETPDVTKRRTLVHRFKETGKILEN